MKDFKNDSNSALSRFGRDKRERTVTASSERVERRPNSQRDAGDAGQSSYGARPEKRASFNPHFSSENRPTFGDRDRKPYGDKPAYGGDRERKPYGDRENKPYGERKSFGDKPAYGGDRERKPYGDKPAYGGDHERKPYGDKPAYGGDRERKPYGDRPAYGGDRERKPYGDKPAYGGDRERKPYGDKPAYGGDRERKPYGDKPAYGGDRERKPYGDKPAYGGDRERKPYGDKPAYSGDRERKPYGDKPAYGGDRERKPYGDKPAYGGDRERKPYGERKSFGDKPAYGGDRERKPYGERKSFGDKPAYGGDRERKPFAAREHKPVSASYPSYNPEKQPGEMRLNRYIAQSGVCSRREADDYITAGLVTVNGTIVNELGSKVMSSDEVKFNDSRVQGEKKVYLMLNKPKGYVTSLDDPHATKTVMELVQNACNERIYPVGRLDKNSLGLLLFTNDGDLTKQLTHPSHQKKKIYQVSLDKALTREDMDRIAKGITLEDGEIFADEISYVKENKKEVGIEIHSGRNRIVRRIFEFLGYEVTKLDRVYYAGITKKNLKRGAWRFLSAEEVQRLMSGQYE